MSDQKEILESIRDLIAKKPGDAGDDDILELTQMVNPDGSVTEITPRNSISPLEAEKIEPKFEEKADNETPAQNTTEKPEMPEQALEKTEEENDILSEIDSLLNESKPARPEVDEKIELELAPRTEKFEIAEEFEATPEEEQEIIQEAQQLATEPDGFEPPIVARDAAENNGDKMEDTNTIISDESALQAKASISDLMGKLKKEGKEANKVEASAPFRSGATVEDLVVEMLKPMMKDWLDKNLPKLVNEIVSKEIQKLIPKD